MSVNATKILEQIETLPEAEQREVFVRLAEKMLSLSGAEMRSWIGDKLSFEEACDVVFRENRALLQALSK